ncbi:MAG: phosphate ABC transporter substrate-binding protein [Spirochaetes bacterium]|nr:phosphate ABC transporter substrate-binding protein [Spirochaetota bacterium]
MKRLLLIFLGLILVCLSCKKEKKELILQGSTTILPIAQRCAEEFNKINPSVIISVRGGGSGVGIASLIDGICDIANASRPIKEKEETIAKEKGFEPVPFIVAKDAIAVIVNTQNKEIEDLNLENLKDIYTGKITNWKEIGGADLKIVIVSRDSSSGTYETFNKLVLKKAKVTHGALYQASNKAVLTIIENTKGAIGYVGLGYLSGKVKALKVNGVYPSKESVLKGDYSLQRPLFMYTRNKPSGVTKDFINYVLSKKGQEFVEEVGFISIK